MAYSLFAWFCTSVLTVFWGTLSLTASLFSGTGSFSHTCMRIWSRQCLRLARTDLRVEGLETIPGKAPVVFAANHRSLVDILVLAAVLPVKFSWIAKKELFRVPFLGWHMRRANYISIDRQERASAVRSMMEAVAALEKGTSLVVFPEESRSRDGKLHTFKKGAFALAVLGGVPVVPIAIRGTDQVIPKGRWKLRKARVRIRILPALRPSSTIRRKAREELMQATYDAITGGLQSMETA